MKGSIGEVVKSGWFTQRSGMKQFQTHQIVDSRMSNTMNIGLQASSFAWATCMLYTMNSKNKMQRGGQQGMQ